MSRRLALISTVILITILLSQSALAGMRETFPIYGYNLNEKICQIKQATKSTPVNSELIGEYWSLQNCRTDNPEIIFYTGRGIIIWTVLLAAILLLNYFRNKKPQNLNSFKIDVIFDLVIIQAFLFFTVLQSHYFNTPMASYLYEAEIDHIVYSLFIKGNFPIKVLITYVIIKGIQILISRKQLKAKTS